MSDFVKSIILGIVEGLTEFLPVSSTAHLRIAQDALGISLEDPFWKMFAIVIQLGAILAVVTSFWKRIVEFAKTFPKNPSNRWWNHPLSFIAISFVVTAIPCFLIDKWIDDILESLVFIACALLVGGVLMWWIDAVFAKRARTESIEAMSLKQAIIIGAAQILSAAFPGTSRSMATIAAGQLVGLNRSTALEFSFLLSVPVMAAATGFKFLQFLIKNGQSLSDIPWGTLAVGFIVSYLVAWGVIVVFLQWVRKHGFAPFAFYRIALGLFLLVYLFTR